MKKITKLFATCLLVTDLEKSLNFYEKKLGLQKKFENDGFVDFELGETGLALFQQNKATAMFPIEHMKPTGGSFLIGFQVSDLYAYCKSLGEIGVKVFEGPKTTTWGQKVAYIKDPDENIIEISEE